MEGWLVLFVVGGVMGLVAICALGLIIVLTMLGLIPPVV